MATLLLGYLLSSVVTALLTFLLLRGANSPDARQRVEANRVRAFDRHSPSAATPYS